MKNTPENKINTFLHEFTTHVFGVDSFELHEHETIPVVFVGLGDVDQDVIWACSALMRSVIEKQAGAYEKRIVFDSNNEKRKHLDNLIKKMEVVRDRVMTYGKPVVLPPMPPHDRFVVHYVFSLYPEIHTESKGVHDERHVCVYFVHNSA